MKIAVYPGSFDPFTNGHLDVLERGLTLFDRVVIGVLANPDKRQPLFTVEERVEMIKESVDEGGRSEVEVEAFTGLTVDFGHRKGASAILRGLRAYSDFDAELQLALMNRKMAPDLITIFLPSSFAHIFVSSSILKDIASHGREVGEFVPPAVARRLKERFE
ncbi:MAG TPA: pantetheine-phosphate adenylyltransferase [Solirubrobacteraceae bacterium]